jgi:cytochrome c peroxidase
VSSPPPKPSAGDAGLGKQLFHDRRIGGRGCVGCHDPARGWADGLPRARRADGELNERHTPSLLEVGAQPHFGWDGRSRTLEAQIREELEVQLDTTAEAVAALAATSADGVVAALAAYVRTIGGAQSAFERFEAGDPEAISESAQRGWLLFRNKAGCTACHVPPLFTDHRFHNLGVGYGERPDPGRERVTGKAEDRGKLKTPSLRAAASSAPYFHDGSAATLAEAIDYVLSGGRPDPHLDSGITRLDLDAGARADLRAFIESLDARPQP